MERRNDEQDDAHLCLFEGLGGAVLRMRGGGRGLPVTRVEFAAE